MQASPHFVDLPLACLKLVNCAAMRLRLAGCMLPPAIQPAESAQRSMLLDRLSGPAALFRLHATCHLPTSWKCAADDSLGCHA